MWEENIYEIEYGGGDVHWGGGLQYDTTRQRMGLVADMQGAVDVDSGDMGSAWVCHMYTTINWMGGTYTQPWGLYNVNNG